MSNTKKYLIYFSLAIALTFSLYGCGSGEYDLEEHSIDYVDKTLKYDTVKKVVIVDTTNKNTEIKDKNNSSRDSYSYIVQIGAFLVKANFDRFFENAKTKLGEQVFFEQANNLYKIRFGKYSDKAEAIKQLEHVKNYGYSDAFIVTVKK